MLLADLALSALLEDAVQPQEEIFPELLLSHVRALSQQFFSSIQIDEQER